MISRDLAHAVADAVIPLLMLLAVLNALIRPPLGDRRAAMKHLGATALGVLSVIAVMILDASLGLWFRAGLDFSTHTALVTSLAISLWRSRPGGVLALGAVLLLNAALILGLGFHSIADVLTSTVVAAVVTLPWRIDRAQPG
jgi:hypothetical protein